MRSTCVAVVLLAVTFTSHGFTVLQKVDEWQAEHISGRGQFRNGVDGDVIRFPKDHKGIELMTDIDFKQVPPPASWDWRTKGVISPVKNQGQMGSVIAFAATECVESLHAIKTGQLEALSTAEVQDCCVSSLMVDNVFQCIHDIGGLCSESTYPAVAGHCRNSSCQPQVQIQGEKEVPKKNAEQMVMALLVNPLLALVDAGRQSFELYTGGVYTDPACSSERVDHALQVVGYGQEGGEEFWICKNSWGTSWGENGYIRIKKGVDMCGIESFASYPY